jgi:hypothetical protein
LHDTTRRDRGMLTPSGRAIAYDPCLHKRIRCLGLRAASEFEKAAGILPVTDMRVG